MTKSVQQAKSNWCWAAVAEMAVDWENPTAGTSQWVSYSYFKDGYGGRKYDQTVYTYFGSVD